VIATIHPDTHLTPIATAHAVRAERWFSSAGIDRPISSRRWSFSEKSRQRFSAENAIKRARVSASAEPERAFWRDQAVQPNSA
jgi:hypothetical protein